MSGEKFDMEDDGEVKCFMTDVYSFNLTVTMYPNDQHLFKAFTWREYLKIIFYVVIMMLTILGNVSVILTVVFNRFMKTTINFYLVNLAVADLLICVCCMWVHLINNLVQYYILGPFMCKLNAFAQMTCLTSSVLTLSAISCDRFIAIMFPLHVRITKQRTSAVITVVWLVAIVASIPFLIYRKYYEIQWEDFVEPSCGEEWPAEYDYDPTNGTCTIRYPSKQIYYTFVTMTLFFMPLAIMATAYCLIVWRLWVSELPGEQYVANINVQDRAMKKVIKMVCVVLLTFFICWIPLQATVLYSQFGHSGGPLPTWFVSFSYFSTYLAYSNSALNPIIYSGFNNNFRQGFWTILKCGCRRKSFIRPQGSQKSRTTTLTGITGSPSYGKIKIINGAKNFDNRRSTELIQLDDKVIVRNGQHTPQS